MPKTTQCTHHSTIRSTMKQAVKKNGGEVEIPEMLGKDDRPLKDVTVRSMLSKAKEEFPGMVFITRKSKVSGKMFLQARRD